MARAIQCRVDAGRGDVRFRGTTPFAGNDYAVEFVGADSASAVLYLMSDDGRQCLAKTRSEGGSLRISLATRPLRDSFAGDPHEIRLFHCLVREEADGADGHVVAEGDMAVAWNPLWDAADAPGGYTMEGPAGPRGERGETGPRGETGERGPQGERGEKGERGDALTWDSMSDGERGELAALLAERMEAASELLKGVEVKTNTVNGMRNAIRAIAQALGAAKVSALAAMLWLAPCGDARGASVERRTLGDLDMDSDPAVVTDVSLEGLATDARLDAATNAVRAYADGAVGAASAAAFERIDRVAAATNALWAAKADRAELAATNALWSAVDANSAGVAENSAALSAKAEKSEVRAVSNDLAAVASSVSTMWWQVYGDTVWMAVTNYLRTTDAKPSMGLWEARDGATNCVWSSAEEIAAKTDALRVELTNSVAAAQSSADAAKSWGKWQSADGSAAVDGFTTVSTPYLMLTGGGHWEQRTMDTGDTLWMLCGDGTLGGGTNGVFKLMDSNGEAVFEVTQGALMEVGARVTSFEVVSPDKYFPVLQIGVAATSAPKIYHAPSPTGPWFDLELAESVWTVTGGTNYLATFTNPSPSYLGSLGLDGFTADSKASFFRAVYETGSESIVKFHRPLSFPKIEIGGTNYTVSVGTMSDGTKFLKLE